MNSSSSTSVCADCGAPDPTWASINRGVLVCYECCSIHRSLGRHISYIRSLQSTNWPPVLKEMVYTLVNKGSNSLWEHALLDPHSKIKIKKPTSRDKLHPTKHDFIVAKYKYLMLLPRPSQNYHVNTVEDLSRQLHASVRTGNLETCLRLLSLGADPNYVNPDRGNTPLHVAAQAGQAMQVELLVANGAHPSTLDKLGHTPEECARIAGHHQLADRLIECQYELSDKLCFFLCGRKPVHNIGEHFLVPQGSESKVGFSEARSRLQELSNKLFEDLAADVYDEVDRREMDEAWLMTQQLQSSVAFLPVNPSLSPLRNQGRQKLATLNSEDFAQLVVHILLDTKRRQQLSIQTGETSGTVVPSTSDDRTAVYDPHDYDEVPLDEGATLSRSSLGATLSAPPTLVESAVPGSTPDPVPEAEDDGLYSVVKSAPGGDVPGTRTADYAELDTPAPRLSSVVPAPSSGTISRAKYDIIKEQLKKAQARNEELERDNQKFQKHISDLQARLNKVIEENVQLRSSLHHGSSPNPATPTSPLPPISELKAGQEEEDDDEEAGQGEELGPNEIYAVVDKSKKTSRSSVRSSSGDPQPPPASPGPQATTPPPADLYAVPLKKSKSSASSDARTPTPVETPPLPRQDTPLSDSAFEELSAPGPTANPSLEDVHAHIKGITQCIQELLQAAQSQRQDSFAPCSKKIMIAVDNMIRSFPVKPASQFIQVSLREVTTASQKLKTACLDTSRQSDLAYRTRHIINSAYDVAKAARHLVMCVEQEEQLVTTGE